MKGLRERASLESYEQNNQEMVRLLECCAAVHVEEYLLWVRCPEIVRQMVEGLVGEGLLLGSFCISPLGEHVVRNTLSYKSHKILQKIKGAFGPNGLVFCLVLVVGQQFGKDEI